MHSRISNVAEQFVKFCSKLLCWVSDTVEKIIYITLDFIGRIIELVLVIMNLAFQIICFLRDMCIESMQTFVNLFRGIVNVISGITRDDVEEFASACIVFILWIVVFKIVMNHFKKSETTTFNALSHRPPSSDDNSVMEKKLNPQTCPPKKSAKRMSNNRYDKRGRSTGSMEDRNY